jgi:hypothetical protein
MMNAYSHLDNYKDMIPVLVESIYSSLNSIQQSRKMYDENVVAEEIINFLFISRPTIHDGNRYEWMHQLSGKASLIAQGWKLNYGKNIEFYEQTQESILSYLEKTYGRPRRAVA